MKGATRPGMCQSTVKNLDQICFRKSTGNAGKVLIPDSLWLEPLANHKQRWQSSSGVGQMCLKSSGSRGRDFGRTFFKIMHTHTCIQSLRSLPHVHLESVMGMTGKNVQC